MPFEDMPGTRADLISTLTFALTLATPLVSLWSFRLARRREHARHRRVQTALLLACFASVVAFEVRILMAGGSGSLIAGAPPRLLVAARALLGAHIIVAVLAYLGWLMLLLMSRRRFSISLPGAFSRAHRRAGWAVFAGLAFSAASATGMYLFAFVL